MKTTALALSFVVIVGWSVPHVTTVLGYALLIVLSVTLAWFVTLLIDEAHEGNRLREWVMAKLQQLRARFSRWLYE